MYKKFKALIQRNKNTILISFTTSVFTFAVLTTSLGAVIYARTGSLDSIFTNYQISQSAKTVVTDTSAEESKVIDVVAKSDPAVVSIVITKDMPVYEQYTQNYNPFGDLFGGFNIPSQKQTGTEKQTIGGGSGFFVSADGYIATNNHVVDDSAADYTVVTSDGKEYAAKVLAKDSTLDVAVLKIDGTNFPYLSFADSDKLQLGQSAIAIGNALAEFQNSISLGIVSGLSRSITAGDQSSGKTEQLEGVIQTDAAINPGNSGGPLLDIRGYVIGVNVAVEYDAQSIGFALPSNTVKSVVDSVIKNGEIVRPYLGVRYIPVTSSLKDKNNLSVDYGVLVSRGATAEDLAVIPNSPASKAGIVEGDIILEIDGTKIDASRSLASIVRQKQVGDTVTLKVLHNGEEKEVKVTLEKLPSNL
jgi:serine protease Do